MKVNAINVCSYAKPSICSTSFGRNFNSYEEKKDYTETINAAQKYLGIQNQVLIMHAPSYPADKNTGNDYKIGSPYVNKDVAEFAKTHGFNEIQLGPMGRLNRGDTSPYTSSIYLKNPLFINLEALEGSDFASILSSDEIEEETYEIEKRDKNYDRADYSEATDISNALLETAYDNFSSKLNLGDEDAEKLYDEFDKFKEQEGEMLDYYAVLDVLAQENGTDYYPYWSEQDASLIPEVKAGNREAIEEYNRIKDEWEYDIDLFKFKQFLINKQSQEYKENGNMPLISDLEVGVSSLDELVFQDAFSKEYKLGCKYGGPFNSPQTWGSPVLDPDKLFNPDGTLGKSGEFLKTKLERALSDSKNIRIDHVMGLVNPYVYKPETVQYASARDENGNEVQYVVRDRLKAGYLSEINPAQSRQYQRILPEIVLPVMRENGVNPDDVVWENLGHDETGVFYKIYNDQEHLNGISGLIWTKGQEAPHNNWAYIGSHDNKPARKMIENHEVQNQSAWNPEYLSKRLEPIDYHQRTQSKYKIENSDKELLKAKYADLLYSTKNIQVPFMDFLGINESYNIPGTTGDKNWTLRVAPDYEEKYYETLEKQNSHTKTFDGNFAINMPEILQMSVRAKANERIHKGEPYEKVMSETAPLLDKLNYYENVLKEA